MIPLQNFNQFIKLQAQKMGFVLCGVSKVTEVEEAAFLENWIEEGRNADMGWFRRNGEMRCNPKLLMEGANSIISFAWQYPPVNGCDVAAYAHAVDYHYTIKERLAEIVEAINKEYGVTIRARVFTDSAPVMERYWARKSGFGWIGKSGLLINRTYGSYLLLGEIVCDVQSDIYDQEDSFNGCSTCRRCILKCPTGAIGNDRSIDARRCLSYLTIEHRGAFSGEQLDLLKKGDWLYGCDTCLQCCPWNSKKISIAPSLFIDESILEMSAAEFRKKFKDTPLERTGVKNIRRNYVGKLF